MNLRFPLRFALAASLAWTVACGSSDSGSADGGGAGAAGSGQGGTTSGAGAGGTNAAGSGGAMAGGGGGAAAGQAGAAGAAAGAGGSAGATAGAGGSASGGGAAGSGASGGGAAGGGAGTGGGAAAGAGGSTAAGATLTGNVTRTAAIPPGLDGIGNLYIAVFDQNPILMQSAKAVGNQLVMNADFSSPTASIPYQITGLPVGLGTLYIVAFLDDDGNATPPNASPKKPDLVTLDGISPITVVLDKPVSFPKDLVLNAEIPF